MEEFKLYEESAERSVIGALLLDNESIYNCEFLKPDMFGFEKYKQVFIVINKMIADNHPADVVTVNSRLVELEIDGLIDGLMGLVAIVQNTPSAANIARYANIVKNKYIDRQLLHVADEIKELVLNGSLKSEEKQQRAEKLISDIADSVSDEKNVTTAYDAVKDTIMHMDKIASLEDGELLGLPTGLPSLDDILMGLKGGEFIVVAGRPSMGKSAFAENIMRFSAKQKKHIRFQTMEMKPHELVQRGIAAEAEIDFGKIQRAEMNDSEWGLFSSAGATYAEFNIVFDEDYITVDKIAARARAQKRKTGLDLLVIDHLGLIPKDEKTNEATAISRITGSLKRLAMELNIPVIALSQLNRKVEDRQDKRPMMSDLRDSGSIEQDANMVLFPWRGAYYFDDRNPNEAEIIVAKNRNGKTCLDGVKVGWSGRHQKFTKHIDDYTPEMPKLTEKSNADNPWDI